MIHTFPIYLNIFNNIDTLRPYHHIHNSLIAILQLRLSCSGAILRVKALELPIGARNTRTRWVD